ncbi:MAG: nitroreductase family deazaflavin-dependent oxidoreductase [Cryobacterium sp.]|nr:nitroreductase family deazaflavin-dependent oxidoreductase [Cryobacterium sp.]
MASVAAWGLLGWWCVRLETANPAFRTPLTLPLVTAKVGGHRYLVSMLGKGAKRVRNVRAAKGAAVIVVGRRHPVRLVEVPVTLRAPILKAYLQRAPGARPHIPVVKDAPEADFEAIAADFQAFEVLPRC